MSASVKQAIMPSHVPVMNLASIMVEMSPMVGSSPPVPLALPTRLTQQPAACGFLPETEIADVVGGGGASDSHLAGGGADVIIGRTLIDHSAGRHHLPSDALARVGGAVRQGWIILRSDQWSASMTSTAAQDNID